MTDVMLLDGDLEDTTDLDSSPQDKLNISRLSRKVNEKIRRDKLNNLIAELAEEVPTIKYAHRRLDKSSVLRLTVSFLKLHQGLKQKRFARESIFKDKSLYNEVKMVNDGMLMVLTQSGLILYVSPVVKKILGYHESDVIGYDISRFVHPDDVANFMCEETEDEESPKEAAFATFDTGLEFRQPRNVQIHGRNKTSFYARMMKITRPCKKKEECEIVEEDLYELMQVKTFRETQENGTSRDDLWMIAYIKPFVQESIKEISVHISEFQKNNEWATMHGLDSRIQATEHRASLFHGFMASDVIGRSPYFFVWDDDLEYVCRSHQLILSDEEIPSTMFRMKTMFGEPLFVQSRSIIIKDKWTKKPKCIVSVNEILSPDDGAKMLAIQKKRVEELTKASEQLSIKDSTEGGSDEKDSQCSSEVQQEISDSQLCDHDTDCSLLSTDIKVEPSSPEQFSIQKKDILAIQKCTGKSLGELYEERALSYHNQIQKPSSSVSSVDSSESLSFSVKRSHDSIDSDSSTPSVEGTIRAASADISRTLHTEGYPCSNTDKSSSQQSQSNNSNPVLKQLLENKNNTKTEVVMKSHDTQTDNDLYSNTSEADNCITLKSENKISPKPILKGILEGNLTLVEQRNYRLTSDTACDSQDIPVRITDTDSLCSQPQSNLSFTSDYDDSMAAFSPSSCGGSNDQTYSSIGASGGVSPIQSPTVGSMAMSEDMSIDQTKVCARFTRQLLLKYGQIKDTFTNHKLMIQALREHLEQTEILMNEQQRLMHGQLINRLKRAETQLGIQDQLLAELEVELATDENKCYR